MELLGMSSQFRSGIFWEVIIYPFSKEGEESFIILPVSMEHFMLVIDLGSKRRARAKGIV
jgi:hypothetical protein